MRTIIAIIAALGFLAATSLTPAVAATAGNGGVNTDISAAKKAVKKDKKVAKKDKKAKKTAKKSKKAKKTDKKASLILYRIAA